MSLSKLEKSNLIIHSCAVGAAWWSGMWGSVPVAGITPDTGGLIAICTIMGGLLASAHGRTLSELSFMGAATAVGQYYAGALIIKGLSGLIPVLGTIVNAAVSLATVEAVGWGIYLILDEGKDLASLSKDEIVEYLSRGKDMRSKFAESGKFAWMDSLPPKIKKKLDELSKELTETHTSEQRRAAIVIEIEQLLAPYRK